MEQATRIRARWYVLVHISNRQQRLRDDGALPKRRRSQGRRRRREGRALPSRAGRASEPAGRTVELRHKPARPARRAMTASIAQCSRRRHSLSGSSRQSHRPVSEQATVSRPAEQAAWERAVRTAAERVAGRHIDVVHTRKRRGRASTLNRAGRGQVVDPECRVCSEIGVLQEVGVRRILGHWILDQQPRRSSERTRSERTPPRSGAPGLAGDLTNRRNAIIASNRSGQRSASTRMQPRV
jgi:hypothetical protein